MNGRLDKIAPGLGAKLNLLFDEAFALLFVLLSASRGGVVDGRVVALCGSVSVAWFFAAAVLRLYSPCSPRTRADSLVLNLVAVTGAAVTLTLAQLLMPVTPPVSPVLFGLCFAAASGLVRLTVLALSNHLEPSLDDVLIVGTGPIAAAAYERLTRGGGEHRNVVGFLRFQGEPKAAADIAPILGETTDLQSVVSSTPVSEVYVAAAAARHGTAMQAVVETCEELGLPFALPVRYLELQRAALITQQVAADGFLHFQATSRAAPLHYAVKRLLDIVASLFALLCLSPLLIGVALAVKLGSKGPVLFKQERVGLHGATFNLFKFRSMVQDAEARRAALLDKNEQTGPVFKIKHDPRITAVGRFIRRYSIDELPQLINILRGDMTVVGPRPALPSEVAQYKPWHRRRLSVRPGLTCLWQVGGRNTVGFDEWMRLDLMYVDTWSLKLDLRLIALTFPVVIAGRGAS